MHKRNKQMHEKAHRPAPSSQSEVITMLIGLTKHEDKEHGKILKHEVLEFQYLLSNVMFSQHWQIFHEKIGTAVKVCVITWKG